MHSGRFNSGHLGAMGQNCSTKLVSTADTFVLSLPHFQNNGNFQKCFKVQQLCPYAHKC